MSNDATRKSFAASAEAYRDSAIHARGDDLGALVAYAVASFGELDGRRALDVATGAGHTAVALARAGAVVAALDVTPRMLAVAKEHAASQSDIGPIAFHEGTAEDLPFDDGGFDLVACRIAAHHFERPKAFLAEARRVLTPEGRLLLVDNVAPEDTTLADAMNHIERLRDPSHVEAVSVGTWLAWMADVGFETERLERFRRTKDVRDWLDRSRAPAHAERELQAFVRGLPERARRYFGVEPREGDAQTLVHEVAFLAARREP